jgi:regulator of RNase E activity RraA
VQVPAGLRAQRDTWTPLMDVLKKDRPRVSDEQLARIAKYPIEALWNGVQNQGYTQNFANHFRLTQPGTKLVGRALTMRYLPLRPDIDAATKQIAKEGDWDFQYNVRAGEDANPGDVIVVELGGAVDRATFLGDVTGIGMKQRGVRGVVVDGGIRDLNEFLVMKDFPIYYVNAHASAMADQVGVEWNAPIRIGHVAVLPGDVVVGDEEGVLFFPPQIVEDVLKSAALTVNTENFKREMMRARAGIVRGMSIRSSVRSWRSATRSGSKPIRLETKPRSKKADLSSGYPLPGPGALAGTDPMRGPIGC